MSIYLILMGKLRTFSKMSGQKTLGKSFFVASTFLAISMLEHAHSSICQSSFPFLYHFALDRARSTPIWKIHMYPMPSKLSILISVNLKLKSRRKTDEFIKIREMKGEEDK